MSAQFVRLDVRVLVRLDVCVVIRPLSVRPSILAAVRPSSGCMCVCLFVRLDVCVLVRLDVCVLVSLLVRVVLCPTKCT